MPPKANPVSTDITSQLLEALKNDSVTEAFAAAIAPSLALSVQEIINKELGQTIKRLVADNKTLSGKVQQLQEENAGLKTRLVSVEERLEVMDRESRGSNIIVRGLPEGSYAERASASGLDTGSVTNLSVANTVCNMFKEEMGLTVHPENIIAAFRMKVGAKDTARPIMVKFSSTKTKESVMRAKKSLREKKSQVFISEHLTKAAADRFAKARALVKQKKIVSAWTYNGNVYIKASSDATARPTIIHAMDDLPR